MIYLLKLYDRYDCERYFEFTPPLPGPLPPIQKEEDCTQKDMVDNMHIYHK